LGNDLLQGPLPVEKVAHPRVSVAIPVHNEEQLIEELTRRVGSVLSALPGGPHELVIVDDGSTDATLARLMEAAKRDSRVVVVILSRNFGHQPALTAALDVVSGDVIVAMDGDLQDPPEAIPTFLSHYEQGYDVVYATRLRRKEGLFLRLSYWAYYRLAAQISAIELPVDAGDFGLMSARVVKELQGMRERHRYLRGLRAWVGFRQIGVLIERGARLQGTTKYTALRLLKLASDGLFAFSIVPLRLATAVGAIAMVSSSAFALYSIVAKFIFASIPRGFTATIVIATFLSGVNLLFLGVIGEYVGRIYEESKERPIYIIDRIVRDGAFRQRKRGDRDMLLSTDEVELSGDGWLRNT
jgi:glycosyltransferase involved in cell wall biosynthesis